MIAVELWEDTQSWVYREYSRGLRTQPCGAPMFRVIELEVNWPTFTTCGLAVRKSWIQSQSEVFRPRSESLTASLAPLTSAESWTHRWAPETNLQWGTRHLDSHRERTPGTSGPLTLWLCCSWNKLLFRLARVELAPRLSLVSPKVFSPFCHRWSFGSLPLSPLACLVGESSFSAKSSTWLHRYYLNWTELDNAITKFNNEMHSAENWVLNPVIWHYWHNLPILILCSALLQFVLLKTLYK